MSTRSRRRITTACGFAAPLVALGAIGLATLLAAPETFTWRARALSDMGRVGTRTFLLFNGGLIAGGLLGVPFGWQLWVAARNGLERVGVALLWAATAALVGIGVFFLGHDAYYLGTELHAPVALLYFGLAPLAQWLYGSGLVLAGDARLGLVSIWLGIAHPLTWLGWLVSRAAAGDPSAWFAVPEFVAAVAFGGWVVALAANRYRRLADNRPKSRI
ncbi:DUF998 domain-containing protein [Haloterrigena alkaliphila]|uniref:DUF998 domain-containing protein n=1 Tax=Haloterrigena alkaliphila TaxID=2816475 RepID=A0A8A2VA47_9EURY|nr:DUF998 domain-containing protein [Haloterrigena alkaliphila]QSW98351.1 DUF998 domain-containing protein [Haloterrigena alkaliphila]